MASISKKSFHSRPRGSSVPIQNLILSSIGSSLSGGSGIAVFLDLANEKNNTK